jgi:hypothetical protein
MSPTLTAYLHADDGAIVYQLSQIRNPLASVLGLPFRRVSSVVGSLVAPLGQSRRDLSPLSSGALSGRYQWGLTP